MAADDTVADLKRRIHETRAATRRVVATLPSVQRHRDALGGCDATERAEAAQTPSNRRASTASHDEREEQR